MKINELLDSIQNELRKLNTVSEIDIPYNQFSIIDEIYKNCRILNREEKDDRIVLKIETSIANINKLKSKIK